MMEANAKELHRGWPRPAPEPRESAPWRWIHRLASLRLTLVVLVLLAGGVVWTYSAPAPTLWPLLVPVVLFSTNLVAAIATHPAFRSHPALLVFHAALLAIVALVALGRLTYLKGQAELAEGEQFAGRLAGYEAGPWHSWALRDVRFSNEGFTIDYQPGRQRDHTRNRVSIADQAGGRRELIIGDQVPLLLAGYRFYTSFNKGFALVFTWSPPQGPPQRGAVHLPAYPIHEYRQANTWTPPGAGSELWVQLRFDEPLLDPQGPARFRTPGSHVVVVRSGDRRVELIPGRSLTVDGGRLRYEGVRTWMGYTVFYDRTIPWLLAACFVAVISLGWHFWRKFAGRPWWTDRAEEQEGT